MRRSRRSAANSFLVVCILFLAASLLVPSPVYADSSTTEDPPANLHQDNDCGTWRAGVVSNNSSSVIRIKGNITEGGDHLIYSLWPGENSEEDTNMCDVDYVNVQQDAWWLWHWRNRNSFVDINFWNINCRDGWEWFGTYVHCTALWAAPPNGPEEPPIPPPGPDEPQPGEPGFPYPLPRKEESPPEQE